MILSRLINYLRQHRRASLTDMAHGLDIAPEALQAMLETLERKGRVKRLAAGTPCSGCSKCDPLAVQIYEWMGSGADTT